MHVLHVLLAGWISVLPARAFLGSAPTPRIRLAKGTQVLPHHGFSTGRWAAGTWPRVHVGHTPRQSTASEPLEPMKEPGASALDETEAGEGSSKSGLLSSIKKRLSSVLPGGEDGEKSKLATMGMYAVLSYGFVSNASYAIFTGIAWYLSSTRSGLSPLAPGQWHFFLGCWAGLFALNNILRLPRLALSVSIAPAFDKFISFIMKRTGRTKTVATVICVLLVNVVGTCTLMASSVLLASLLSGVPIRPLSAP